MISEQVVFYLLENVVTATRVNYGILTAIFVGLIEEGSKFFFLYRFTWKDKAFNYRFDGCLLYTSPREAPTQINTTANTTRNACAAILNCVGYLPIRLIESSSFTLNFYLT